MKYAMVSSKGSRGLVCFALAALAAFAAHAATFEELAAEAAAARDADQVPKAIGLYLQALQLKPDWSEGWFYLGTLYYDTDRYADAQPAFAHNVALDDQPAGRAFLGLCEFETGSYTRAREDLEKALRGGLPPQIGPVVLFRETLLLTRLGLFERALHGYTTLVQRGVHDATLIAALGLNSLNRAILPGEIPPDQQELVAAAGRTAYLWMSGDSPKTESAFHDLVNRYPAAPGVHSFYAFYLLSAQPERAQEELGRELQVNPRSVEARAMLALLLWHMGNAPDASSYAKKAVEDGPTSPMAQYAYGLTLADPKEAAVHLEIAEGMDPDNFDYHVALAHVYSESGRNEEARRERKISIQLARGTGARGPG